MSKSTGHVEEKEFLVREFLWVDGEYSGSSGALLSVLDRLANAEVVTLTDNSMIDYLLNKGLITKTDTGYTVAEAKAYACITLGNNINRAVTKKLSDIKPAEIDFTKNTN